MPREWGRGGEEGGGAVSVPRRVFSLKKSTAGAFTVPCRDLRGKRNSSHAHKAGSWYLLGVLFKVSDGHPLSFLYGSPPSLGLMVNSLFETCLQGIIVVAFIISDWIIVLMNTATMITYKHVSEGIAHS